MSRIFSKDEEDDKIFEQKIRAILNKYFEDKLKS